MENLLEKESVKRVNNYIKQFDSTLKITILDKTARTAKDAATALNCEVGAIIKSLILRADNSFLLCLVAGDKKCSLNKVKKLTGKKDVCMADAEKVKLQTGFSIGGVAPVAHLNKLEVLIDSSLGRFKYIYGAAGHPNCIFKISYSQLIKITKGLEKEISE
jgi:prolyl-tRNA editing enzyme YbaK/EbsC (Cys-tRNA(Pro) deacylase)